MPLGASFEKEESEIVCVCVVVVLCVSYIQTHKVHTEKYVIIISQSISVGVCCGRYSLYKKLLPNNHVFECSHTFPLTNTLMFQMVISTFV